MLALLKERLGRGELNTETTKVLHFIRNPEAELAQRAEEAKLEALQAENDALRVLISQATSAEPGSNADNVAAATAKAQVVSLERKVRKEADAASLMSVESESNGIAPAPIFLFQQCCGIFLDLDILKDCLIYAF